MVLLAAGGCLARTPDLNSLPRRRRLDSVDPAEEFIVAALLPIAAIYGLIASARAARWASDRRDNLNTAGPEPIDRLAANLRRLRAQLENMETRTDLPHKNLRLRALRGAYVDALGTACKRLGVSPPSSDRAGQAEIYRVEAELRQRGLDVREPAAR
jgi:hypothetical protein